MFGFRKKQIDEKKDEHQITLIISKDFTFEKMIIDKELLEIFKLYKGYGWEFENELCKFKIRVK